MGNERAKRVIAVLVLLVTLALPVVTSANAVTFTDVKPGASHYEGISWVTQKGINGYPDGTYGPNKPLSRQHAALFFVAVLDIPKLNKSEVTRYFDDVSPTHAYADAIATVAKEKIFTGYNKKFNPTSTLTREQMATVLVSAFDLESNGKNVAVRLDNVSGSHKANVQIIADLGITSQLGNFNPSDPVTRGQFATFLYQTFKHIENIKEEPKPEPQPEPEPQPGPEPEPEPQPEPQPEPEPELENLVETKRYNVDIVQVASKQMAAKPQTDSRWAWYNAGEALVAYYLNPNNFPEDDPGFYQFLKLDELTGVAVEDADKYILNGKGILHGTAEYFIEASEKYGINEVYLMAHALLETGNGTSDLSTGALIVNDKPTYNMFGIGALDKCANKCGSEHAYEQGWFTPREAILGGAEFIYNKYIKRGQDTIYKMRWNPDEFVLNNRPTHQYATDVGWAAKQAIRINRFYNDLSGNTLAYKRVFEVPVYNNQPAKQVRPFGEAEFAIDTSNQGDRYTTTANNPPLNVRSAPSTAYSIVAQLQYGTEVEVIGQNAGWYKIRANGHVGWVSTDYLEEVKEPEEEPEEELDEPEEEVEVQTLEASKAQVVQTLEEVKENLEETTEPEVENEEIEEQDK